MGDDFVTQAACERVHNRWHEDIESFRRELRDGLAGLRTEMASGFKEMNGRQRSSEQKIAVLEDRSDTAVAEARASGAKYGGLGALLGGALAAALSYLASK